MLEGRALTSQTEKQTFGMLLVHSYPLCSLWTQAFSCGLLKTSHLSGHGDPFKHAIETYFNFILAISSTYYSLYSIKANITLSFKAYENSLVSR